MPPIINGSGGGLCFRYLLEAIVESHKAERIANGKNTSKERLLLKFRTVSAVHITFSS